MALDCRLNPNDSFEPNAFIGKGKFKGQCLDTSKFRSYWILNEQEISRYPRMKAEFDEGRLIVANLEHQGAFHLASLNIDSISKIIFQIERFPPEWIAAHTQLRLQFKDNDAVKLFDQTNPGVVVAELKEIVMSVEAAYLRQGAIPHILDELH